MRTNVQKTFYFHADASSLGGFIEKPFLKHIPAQASASLPGVGGHVTAETGPFSFEGVVSCRSSSTRISGRQVEEDGSGVTSVTSVVEGLNILEVVKAERLVAQISFKHTIGGGLPEISFAGSRFEGLQIGGCDVSLTLNPSLLEYRKSALSKKQINYSLFQEIGRLQADTLIKSVKADDGGNALQWLTERYSWMQRQPGPDGCVLCSLVDGVALAVPGQKATSGGSFGHVVEIPDFGTIFLGEILAFPASTQLSMIRAELGCTAKGGMGAAMASGNGHMVPP